MLYHANVPKKFNENIAYRVRLRERAELDPDYREAVIHACREDILYFLNAWCWLLEPRPRRDAKGRVLPDIIPFITWPHQDPVIQEIRERLGFDSIGVEKARGEGMSWIAVYMVVHDLVFSIPGRQVKTIGIVSRNMEAGDSPDDPASLGWKIDFALKRLPTWMAGEEYVGKEKTAGKMGWKRSLTNHNWRMLHNGATASVYAATGEVGSGGRYSYFICDELSKFPPGDDERALTSTQPATESRLIIGTPYGSEGAYYKVMHDPSSMVKLVLDWKDNPTRNRGLYRMVANRPVASDPVNNPLPADYNPPSSSIQELFDRLRRKGFRLEKGIRSPWYDKQCDEPNATPYTIAQEYDRDYGGSMFKIFGEEFFQKAREGVRQPTGRVTVEYDDSLVPHVTRDDHGLLHLWMTLDTRNRPPGNSYVVSCDICTGLGGAYTSNSVLEIIDTVNGEQVGEWASNTIEPDDFADFAVAVCYWLGDAYLAWERNGGPGHAFTNRVRKIGYPNIYYHTKLFEKTKRRKTRVPGWYTDTKSKDVMFMETKRIVTNGELKLHSKPLVEECHQYVRIGKAIEHFATTKTNEGADIGEAHGDRVMALGVGVMAMLDRPLMLTGGSPGSPGRPVEPGSIEERDREYFESLKRVDDDWDDRTNWDLMTRGKPGGIL